MMDSVTIAEPNIESVETLLRDELARGDATLSAAPQILHHLLVNEDHALFNDEVVARTRGMLSDIARQLLHTQAEAALLAQNADYVAEDEEALAEVLLSEPTLLRHVHALALEGQSTLRLQMQGNVDPVLSPLLQDLIAAEDEATASAAMAVLAAQARFVQHHRRMSLPLGELPAELFHAAVMLFRSHVGDSEDAAAAERALRQNYDESHGRLALVSHLMMRLRDHAPSALKVGHAGVAIFATGLAMAAEQERALTVLSFADRQYARLVLALLAAGLERSQVGEQFAYLHPEIALPEGLEMLSRDQAALLLAASSTNGRD